ncbi:conserved hypothetical protein [Coccidioides posadasii str. Silveira]|uniref:Uncharacterized protein n=1 Tax=Coccidioides posadasii (strain RMSCC 757 / Silveira) TaxID=443226 RepID=E9DAI6_COCPS|nr:conserved hypothetical protein [Coccidioides posadasii str. Silveira]
MATKHHRNNAESKDEGGETSLWRVYVYAVGGGSWERGLAAGRRRLKVLFGKGLCGEIHGTNQLSELPKAARTGNFLGTPVTFLLYGYPPIHEIIPEESSTPWRVPAKL